MQVLTRQRRIDILSKMVLAFKGKPVEIAIGLPTDSEDARLRVVATAVKGLKTARYVAVAFVVQREAWGVARHDVREFQFNAATFDRDDRLWTFRSPSGLECTVEQATRTSRVSDALEEVQSNPDRIADSYVALRKYVLEAGNMVPA